MEEKLFFRTIQNPETLYPGLWTVASFKDAYKDVRSFNGCSLAYVKDDPYSPNDEDMALVTLRSCIQKGKRLKEGQKYIMAIRFYSFGDMATIDLISLDMDNHRDIASEHLKRIGWSSDNAIEGVSFSKITQTFNSPYIFLGGTVKLVNNLLHFTGSSADYGSQALLLDSNDLASFVAQSCGINSLNSQMSAKISLKEMLYFMMGHKRDEHFYELFFQDIRQRAGDNEMPVYGHHISSLMFMKAADRAVSEDKDFLQLSVEEMSEGFGRFAMVTNVAHNIHKKNKKTLKE